MGGIFRAACCCWALAAGPAPLQGQGMDYEFQQDLTPYYALVRDGKFVLGHLDAAGNFIPVAGMAPLKVGQAFSGPAYTELNVARNRNEPVFEYRSGRLVKGVLDREGNFVPDAGSTVLDFKDYRYAPDAVRIYNLPGRFVKKGEAKPKEE
jgi:hypothetical protein